MRKPKSFAHIVYRTRRFAEMIDWYQKVFLAKVQYQNELIAFLTYDEEHHRFAFINLAHSNSGEDKVACQEDDRPLASGVDHVAYTYKNLVDLLKTYSSLKEHGITPYWPIHHGVSVSLYYRDPDGNRLEFQADCFATSAEGKNYMHSDAWASNPIGVEFDPEEFIARLESGTPVTQLLARPDGPAMVIPDEHYT
ncbi:MAG TPA: biphenyl 2,3-dioxygenase [Gammaproteobacteria bacterium]|nr:biphenyl 2,3-dioxygenase [Gammaproteobacteria bacterium]